jgi:hypothetical protein
VVRPECVSGMRSFVGACAFVVAVDAIASPLVLRALHVVDGPMKSACSDSASSTGGDEQMTVVTRINR